MVGNAIDRWATRIANIGASLQFAKSLLVGFLATAGVEAMEAWNSVASQNWGVKVVLGVAIGVALGYAVLGLLALVRRFLPSRSKVLQPPQVSASPSASLEKRSRGLKGAFRNSRDQLMRFGHLSTVKALS